MIIKGAKIYNTRQKTFIQRDIEITDGIFTDVNEIKKEADLDLSGKYIVPGFCDIHTHGGAGIDMISASAEDFLKLAEYYGKNGITTVFPTTISTLHKNTINMIREVKKAKKMNPVIDFGGIHIEGPYINVKKAGAHDISMIKNPDFSELDDFISEIIGAGLKCHMTIAPELPESEAFMKKAKATGVTFTIGHTEADRAQVEEAIRNGAVSFTHLFNAMPQIHHRSAGTVIHALNADTYVEVICDGIHLCSDVVELVNKIKSIEKIILVSDSMSAAGLENGSYVFESMRVEVKNGRATIKGTDTIAGSTTNIFAELKNFMRFTGEKIESALYTTTKNPLSAVDLYDKKGSIENGKDADFIVLDEKFDISSVYCNGRKIV